MGKNALPTCGLIGLGSQGAPIARRMIKAGCPTARFRLIGPTRFRPLGTTRFRDLGTT
jgi:hypothetical protein